MTIVHETAEMLAHKLGLEHPDTIAAFKACERIAEAERELDTLYAKWLAEDTEVEDDEPLEYVNDDWDDFEAVDDEVGFDPYLGEYTYDV